MWSLDHLARDGQLLRGGIPAKVALADEGLAVRENWLFSVRALLAQARCGTTAHTSFRVRYRDMAKTLGSEGHIEWAAAMP